MDRNSEVEILAATLDEPAKALLRAALVAQRHGRLDAAARACSDQVKKRPALLWPALLLALNAAELRLGGSVAYATPNTRFAASPLSPVFMEKWGPFGCTVFPDGERAQLLLTPEKGGMFLLRAAPLESKRAALQSAVDTLAEQCCRHFGVAVKVEWAVGPIS